MSLEAKIDLLNKNLENLIRVLQKKEVLEDSGLPIVSQKQDGATRFIPVPDWNNYHGWPPIGGLRNLIFHRSTNGLDDFKVIKKVGKRVLIDEKAFFSWLDQNPEIKK